MGAQLAFLGVCAPNCVCGDPTSILWTRLWLGRYARWLHTIRMHAHMGEACMHADWAAGFMVTKKQFIDACYPLSTERRIACSAHEVMVVSPSLPHNRGTVQTAKVGTSEHGQGWLLHRKPCGAVCTHVDVLEVGVGHGQLGAEELVGGLVSGGDLRVDKPAGG